MGKKPKIKVGIVGVGKSSSSIGLNLVYEMLKNDVILSSIDAILLNNRDENIDTVMEQISYNLCHARDAECAPDEESGDEDKDALKGLCSKLLVPKKQCEIAKESAITFFCYESRYGASKEPLETWVPNIRKYLLKGNLPLTETVASNFKNAFGQCVIVTNPCLNIAKAFQEIAGLENGQVVAFNPDYVRFCERFRRLEKAFPGIKEYIFKALLVGDHGCLHGIVVPKDFSKKFPDVNLDKIVAEVMREGLYIVQKYGNVEKNIVPHMINYLARTIEGTPKKSMWGIPYGGVWCSLPITSKCMGLTPEGYPIYRAFPVEELVSTFWNEPKIVALRGLLAEDQKKHSRYAEIKIEQSVAVVRQAGDNKLKVCGYNLQKPLDVLCNDTVSNCQVAGDTIAVATFGCHKRKGQYSGVSSLRLAVQDQGNQSYKIIKSDQPGAALDFPFVHSLATDGKRHYAGVIEEDAGTIVVYDGAKAPAKIKTGFKPCAMTTAPDCIYCADDKGIIRKLDKESLEEKARITVEALKGREAKELFYLNEGRILCARTHPAAEKSAVAIMQNNVLKETFDVQNNAFYAALIGGKTALFYGKGKEVTMRFMGENKRKSFELDWEVCSIGFDSEYNCLYVGAGTCVKIYPFDPVSRELILDKDKVREINLNMPMKLSELKVGRIWEQ